LLCPQSCKYLGFIGEAPHPKVLGPNKECLCCVDKSGEKRACNLADVQPGLHANVKQLINAPYHGGGMRKCHSALAVTLSFTVLGFLVCRCFPAADAVGSVAKASLTRAEHAGEQLTSPRECCEVMRRWCELALRLGLCGAPCS
jgi:hypothetical protein